MQTVIAVDIDNKVSKEGYNKNSPNKINLLQIDTHTEMNE